MRQKLANISVEAHQRNRTVINCYYGSRVNGLRAKRIWIAPRGCICENTTETTSEINWNMTNVAGGAKS